MDWKKISKKYPKAFEAFSDWKFNGRKDLTPFMYMALIKDVRILYDFFDENEIWITINADNIKDYDYPGSIKKGEIYFWININWIYEDDIKYLTRTEAEEAAFNKAFEILEQKQ